MKKTFQIIGLFCLLMLISPSLKAQIGLGFGYTYTQTYGEMQQNFGRNAHGIYFPAYVYIPKLRSYIGINYSYAGYGRLNNIEKDYQFSNYYARDVELSLSSKYSNYNLTYELELMRRYKVRPFVAASYGSTRFWTKLTVYDPEEGYTSECPKPLEQEIIFDSPNPQTSATLGLRIVLGKEEHTEESRTGFFCIDLSITALRGGEVSYMSLKNNISNPSQGDDVTIKFASEARPEIVHPYYVGKVYTSPLKLLLIQAGLSIRVQRQTVKRRE